MSASASKNWKYLDRKPGSAYRQLFVKGTRIMARVLYGLYMNEDEPMTLEEIAENFSLPLEAVREAIAYCESDPPEIREDWEREEALLEASGMNDPAHKYQGESRSLSPQEINRILRG